MSISFSGKTTATTIDRKTCNVKTEDIDNIITLKTSGDDGSVILCVKNKIIGQTTLLIDWFNYYGTGFRDGNTYYVEIVVDSDIIYCYLQMNGNTSKTIFNSYGLLNLDTEKSLLTFIKPTSIEKASEKVFRAFNNK